MTVSQFKGFWRTLGANLADGLEKSTVGAMILFGCLVLIAILVFREGGTNVTENLIITAIIVSASLMGVNTLASTYKDITSLKGKKTDSPINKNPA